MENNIYDWVKAEEKRYEKDIQVADNWAWNMKTHIWVANMMKHGKFLKGTNQLETKNPKKNIVYTALNTRYRAEDIDLKDVTLYVDDPSRYHLSFLVKKYHDEVYVREHDLDTLFDEVKEEKIDLGGALVRKGARGPVHETLESIAFCDQTDILSGPIAFKDNFSPDELLEMAALGWGDEANGATTSLEDLIRVAEESKEYDANNQKKNDTPGKYIEVYRIHAVLPTSWLSGNDSKDQDKETYTRQIQIIAYYKNNDGFDAGVTLYRKKEHENPFKLILSGKKIRNRALAYGGVEELIDPQIWTDYSEIAKKDMLDAASKVILYTDDPTYTQKNKLRNMENLQVTTIQQNSEIKQVPNGSPNIQLFNEWIQEWDAQSQATSGATEALMGKNPSAGTPFRLEALVAQQGMGLHEYRRGKYATFIAEIYEDWIIPDIAKEITKGVKFLATLSPDEMEYVSDCVARNQVWKEETEAVLNGDLPYSPEDRDARIQELKDNFGRKGNKHFIEILKGEFEDVSLSVKVNVAGKQKDLMGIVDRLTNIFRQIFTNPMILQDPKAVKVLNKIIEYSGLDPIDFGYTSQNPQQLQAMQQTQQPQMAQPMPQPVRPVAQPLNA